MHQLKSRAKLMREIKEIDAFLKRVQVQEGGCFSSLAFSHLLTCPSNGKTYKELLDSEEVATASYYSYTNALKKRGYLRFVSRKAGGCGWTVPEKYATKSGEGAVKTTVLDYAANLKSKLNPASKYLNALELITHIRNIAPNTTVFDLYDMLKRNPEFEELCGQQDKSGESLAGAQAEMEQYKLDYVRFFTHGLPQELNAPNLWQLYRICQAFGVAEAEDATKREAEPVPQVEVADYAESVDDYDSPF